MKRFLVAYFLFLFFSLALFSSGIIDSQDGFLYLAVARNIYYKHEPTAPPYEYTGGMWVGKNIPMNVSVGKDGKTYSQTGLGYSLAMIPAVAITDLVYRYYHINPPIHFPLESDWLILMLAGLTNSVLAAGLGIILYLYFLALKLSKRHAFIMSLVSIFLTNLFALSKHSFAHMMFITFLTLSFLSIKYYSITRKSFLIFLSAVSYGIVVITYNQTFLLTLPAYILYWILLLKPSASTKQLRVSLKSFLLFVCGIMFFALLYYWIDNTRAIGQSYASLSFPLWYIRSASQHFSISVFMEGLYGQLLSPGRSIFIYSPTLLIIFIFWHRIRKSVKAELAVFLMLFTIYIIFYAMQRSYEVPYGRAIGYWHGESSWGPRYLSPIIPFGMLIVGHIYKVLSNKAKTFILVPLLVSGLFVGMLGTLMPYQIKFHDLETDIFISGQHYTSFVYSNLLPQFSPIYLMTKKLIKLTQAFPLSLNHTPYNVWFYDGIDFPFNVGPERWRTIEGKGYISFDDWDKDPAKKVTFGLINHTLSESSSSANLQFFLNGQPLLEKPKTLQAKERAVVEVPLKTQLLKKQGNQLIIEVQFENFQVPQKPSQILGLISMSINNNPINKESLNFPYISSLGPAITGLNYNNYGGAINNPWKAWDIHSQIYERVPDFWWAKAMYYWDLPSKFFLSLFLINIGGIMYFGTMSIKFLKHK